MCTFFQVVPCRHGGVNLLLQDCEFTYLSTQILHLLGVEGPKTKDPAKYIRFIYNRIILENATVRAAAVSSLAKFGALVEDLRPRIRVLLSRALHDNDDEVGLRSSVACLLSSTACIDHLPQSWRDAGVDVCLQSVS